MTQNLPAMDTLDFDLRGIHWTKHGRTFYNPKYGYLHRIIAARHAGRKLDSGEAVVYIDDDAMNCTRANLRIVDRATHASEKRNAIRRMHARMRPDLIHAIAQEMSTGMWRVLSDDSMHESEEQAIKHYKAVTDYFDGIIKA